MIRIFADDLETALRQFIQQPDLDILAMPQSGLNDVMKKYLAQKFTLSLDHKRQEWNLLGHEKDGEAFVFYIEVSPVRKWKQISVRNNVLTEIYDDQNNLVHVTVGEKVKSLRLNQDKPVDEIVF